MRHRLERFNHLRAQDLSKGDEPTLFMLFVRFQAYGVHFIASYLILLLFRYRWAFVGIAIVHISNCLCACNIAVWPAFIQCRRRCLLAALADVRGVVRSRRVNASRRTYALRERVIVIRDRYVVLYVTHLPPLRHTAIARNRSGISSVCDVRPPSWKASSSTESDHRLATYCLKCRRLEVLDLPLRSLPIVRCPRAKFQPFWELHSIAVGDYDLPQV